MHLQIRRFAFSMAALLASFGVASAQGTWSPNPQFPPAFPKPKATEGTVQAQATTALTAAPAAAGCTNCAPAAAAPAAAGCSSCAPAAPTHAAASAWCQDCSAGPRLNLASKLISPFTIGQGCASPLGCSSLASERTFLFGSCNQFFNAGNKCGQGTCLGGPIGSGGLGDHQRCAYGSNLNR